MSPRMTDRPPPHAVVRAALEARRAPRFVGRAQQGVDLRQGAGPVLVAAGRPDHVAQPRPTEVGTAQRGDREREVGRSVGRPRRSRPRAWRRAGAAGGRRTPRRPRPRSPRDAAPLVGPAPRARPAHRTAAPRAGRRRSSTDAALAFDSSHGSGSSSGRPSRLDRRHEVHRQQEPPQVGVRLVGEDVQVLDGERSLRAVLPAGVGLVADDTRRPPRRRHGAGQRSPSRACR